MALPPLNHEPLSPPPGGPMGEPKLGTTNNPEMVRETSKSQMMSDPRVAAQNTAPQSVDAVEQARQTAMQRHNERFASGVTHSAGSLPTERVGGGPTLSWHPAQESHIGAPRATQSPPGTPENLRAQQAHNNLYTAAGRNSFDNARLMQMQSERAQMGAGHPTEMRAVGANAGEYRPVGNPLQRARTQAHIAVHPNRYPAHSGQLAENLIRNVFRARALMSPGGWVEALRGAYGKEPIATAGMQRMMEMYGPSGALTSMHPNMRGVEQRGE